MQPVSQARLETLQPVIVQSQIVSRSNANLPHQPRGGGGGGGVGDGGPGGFVIFIIRSEADKSVSHVKPFKCLLLSETSTEIFLPGH